MLRPLTMPDLACGAEVQATTSAVTWDDGGERYYFCSADCRRAFIDDLGGDLPRARPA